MTGDLEVRSYAAARWPAVLRTLVLLGAPPALAVQLATEAVARLHETCAEDDEWLDLDTALFAEVLDVWRHDPTPWWHRPSLRSMLPLRESGLDELEPTLDALDPDARARLVLTAVAQLAPDQVDDVVRSRGQAPEPAAVGEVARLAARIPVADGTSEAGLLHWQERRRARRTATVVGAVAVLVVVAALSPLVVGALDRPPTVRADAASAAPSDVTASADTGTGTATGTATQPADRAPDLVAPWYDGRAVHLGDVDVEVRGVLTMARVDGGVVATVAGGDVVLVLDDGTVTRIGRTTADGVVDSNVARGMVSWIDGRTGGLVQSNVRSDDARIDPLPDGARLVTVDGLSAYAAVGDRLFVADPWAGVREIAGPAPLDVSAGVRLVDAGRDGLQVTSEGRELFRVEGERAELSEDGRYLLARDSATGAADVVVDVRAGASVSLPLPRSGVLVDAAFASPTSVTYVISRANGAPYPADWPRDDVYHPGYDLVTCRLLDGTCALARQLFDVRDPPLLAH